MLLTVASSHRIERVSLRKAIPSHPLSGSKKDQRLLEAAYRPAMVACDHAMVNPISPVDCASQASNALKTGTLNGGRGLTCAGGQGSEKASGFMDFRGQVKGSAKAPPTASNGWRRPHEPLVPKNEALVPADGGLKNGTLPVADRLTPK
uniref:Uncharacterized protein n=1 Tax=Anopheles albimanus TaxID=7167 RepID=A0A182FRI2_ANOAL